MDAQGVTAKCLVLRPVGAEVGRPSAEELRDEQRRIRYVQFIVDLTTS